MNNMIFIGAGGHAKVIYDMAKSVGFEPLAYIDNNVHDFFGLKKLNDSELTTKNSYALSFGAITVEALIKRGESFERYEKQGLHFPTLIHKSAHVSEIAELGAGTTVSAKAVVNPYARIGKAVIINTASVIEHDVEVGDFTHIAPGAIVLGGAQIGKNCMIGAGSVVLPQIKIPDNTLVKAASLAR